MANLAPRAPGAPAPHGRVDFNALVPPKGYVPGLGRGASGFTTRSDIGPSAPAADKPGGGGGGEDGRFDEFLGNDSGVLAAGEGQLDVEDVEAEAAWEAVEARMRGRRSAKREADARAAQARDEADAPRIAERFADLKRDLAGVSKEAWEAIPEIGETTNKKARRDLFTPAPDSLLAGAMGAAGIGGATVAGAIGPAVALGQGGPPGSAAATAAAADLGAVGAGRSTMVRLKLDHLSDSVSGQTVVDPQGYLTGLSSVVVKSDAEVGDIKKARLLLRSVTTTNPGHAPGWIAAARLEEVAGKLPRARALALEGCERCPSDPGVWLEAARLHPRASARAVLARAVASAAGSPELWLAAAELEDGAAAQRRVLLRALEHLPHSVRIWKAAVERSDEDDARTLLARAVECCPQHVELWLALAKLETYKNARKVLTNARKAVPASGEILLASLQLVEANHRDDGGGGGGDGAGGREADGGGPPKAAAEGAGLGPPLAATSPSLDKMLDAMAANGFKFLRKAGATVDREAWLADAGASELSTPSHPRTAAAIARAVALLGVEREDYRKTLLADARESARRGALEVARSLLRVLASTSPGDEGAWLALVDLEKKALATARDAAAAERTGLEGEGRSAGAPGAPAGGERRGEGSAEGAPTLPSAPPAAPDPLPLRRALSEATAMCPLSVTLWLAAAEERRDAGDVPGARAVLQRAFISNPDAEGIWLAAAEGERAAGEPERARELLARAREHPPASTPEVWLRAAEVERDLGDEAAEIEVLEGGVERHPRSWRLHEALALAEQRRWRGGERADSAPGAAPPPRAGGPDGAEDGDALSRAAAAWARGARLCPTAPALWVGAARLELLRGSLGRARAVLERGRAADPPGAPRLWLEAVRVEDLAGSSPAGDALLSRGLQAHRADGPLLAESVRRAPKPQRRARAVDALKRADADPLVVAQVARLFWAERKLDKARSWLLRAVAIDPSHGDAWALLLKFARRHGGPGEAADVLAKARVAKPQRGPRWEEEAARARRGDDVLMLVLARLEAETDFE